MLVQIYVTVLITFVLLGCQKDQPQEIIDQRVSDRANVRERKAVSRDELVSAFESNNFDLTISVMNRVKMTRYQGDLIPLLKNVWGRNLVDIHRANREFVEHPRIRLEIANVLLQASRNDLGFNLEPNAYNEYARLLVHSNDADIAIQAISVLNIANNPVDFPLIQKILAEENNATYRMAAIAFANNCAATQDGVDRVSNNIIKSEVRDYLKETWLGVIETRKIRCEKLKWSASQ